MVKIGEIYDFKFGGIRYKVEDVENDRYVHVVRLEDNGTEMDWRLIVTVDELQRDFVLKEELQDIRKKQEDALKNKILVETEKGDEWVTLDEAIEKGYH